MGAGAGAHAQKRADEQSGAKRASHKVTNRLVLTTVINDGLRFGSSRHPPEAKKRRHSPSGVYRIEMQTMDSLVATDGAALPPGALSSPAARRNAAPILGVLKAHMPKKGRVLEVAAGSGEHALIFACALPGVTWTPSDPSREARDSIDAWRRDGPSNLRKPLPLDAADPATWPPTAGPETAWDAVYCANMAHISPWSATEGLMVLAGRMLRGPGGLLALYGPYREADLPLSPSNAAFDESLKARNPSWGLRAREDVEDLARSQGLVATRRVQMPSNNLMLLFRRA